VTVVVAMVNNLLSFRFKNVNIAKF
jgi:hypothetical protein